MSKNKIKFAFGKISILLIVLFSFTNSMAADDSLRQKIDALKQRMQISSETRPAAQDFCTLLIMLPTKYNPDKNGDRRHVPLGDVQKTALEILEKFDQCSTIDPFPKVGLWRNTGPANEIVEDVNVTLILDKVSRPKKEQLINYCREVLLERFQQSAIHVRVIPENNSYNVMIVEKKS